MELENLIMSFVAVVIGVILVGGVVLPSVYDPINPTANSTSNSTAFTDLTKETGQHNYTTSNVDSSRLGVLVVTHTAFNQAYRNINVSLGSTRLGNFTNSTSDSFSLTGSQVNSANPLRVFYTGTNETNVTVSAATITYYSTGSSTQQGWNSAVSLIWSVLLAIVIIAAFLLLVMKMF